MKVILKRVGKEWRCALHRGNGGVSSLVASRQSKSLLWALRAFSVKNILKTLS